MKIFANRASCKWVKHYMILIERARNRQLKCYFERHHVVPRCMGGGDESNNLVALTPEEHYTAHLLLMKIFPENGALVRAASMMCVDSPSTPRRNKAYGWVKRKLAVHKSKQMKEWHHDNKHPMKGRKHTDESRAKISAGWNGVVKSVYCFSVSTGKLVKKYANVAEAATEINLHPQTIYSCIRIPGKRTAGGYSWSYDNNSPGIVTMHSSGKRKIIVHHKDSKTRQKSWAHPKAHTQSWANAGVIEQLINSPKELASFIKNSKSPNTTSRIAKKIRAGWNPFNDNEWKKWKESLNENI